MKIYMKRFIPSAAAMIVLLCSCSGTKTETKTALQQEQPATDQTAASPSNGVKDYSAVDLDMSKMNYNIISGITFEMLIDPDKYVGKSVKITGQFTTTIHEGYRGYSAFIWDATGCCPAGLDFIPPEGMVYPDDFPQEEQTVTVYGYMDYRIFNERDQLWLVAERLEF